MTEKEVIDLFSDAGALLEGHFVYASGRHGRRFLQAARVLQFPAHTERLCKAIAGRFAGAGIEVVCGPATGGIILAYETARHLGCRAMFTERDETDELVLRRGFRLEPRSRVLVVEDIITTGGSVKKTVTHLRKRGAEVVGVAALIDRSAGEAQFDCRFEPLARLPMESWHPDRCVLCKQKVPLVDPDELLG